MTGIFDSHSHYDDVAFSKENTYFKISPDGCHGESPEEFVSHVLSRGVSHIMTCGTTIESSMKNRVLAESLDNVYFSAGIHPECVEDCPEDYIDKLKEMLKSEKAGAVGEIGLDYYYDTPKELQKKIFEEQILLAKELSLPVIVHDREAHQDTFDILMKHRPRGVLHCYSGSVEMAKEYVKQGFYLGITGVVTFKNSKKVKELAEWIPLDKLLIETDAPYLAPVPYRGYRNDSSFLFYVAEEIGRLKNKTPQEIIDITRENACILFNI